MAPPWFTTDAAVQIRCRPDSRLSLFALALVHDRAWCSPIGVHGVDAVQTEPPLVLHFILFLIGEKTLNMLLSEIAGNQTNYKVWSNVHPAR
jgi:hypothetical protein